MRAVEEAFNDKCFILQEFKELWPKLDMVVDGGRIVEDEGSSSRSGSTVVDLATQGAFKVVRTGRYELVFDNVHEFS